MILDTALNDCNHDLTCAISRCNTLCYNTWGTSCTSYTAVVRPNHINGRYTSCVTFSTDCVSTDDQTPDSYGGITPEWTFSSSGIESYGSVGPNYATSTSFFCHQYSRRALHDTGHGRSLENEDDFVLALGLTTEMIDKGTVDGVNVRKSPNTRRLRIKAESRDQGANYNYDGVPPKSLDVVSTETEE